MKSSIHRGAAAVFAAALFGLAGHSFGAAFTGGDLVVSVVGDGTAALSSNAASAFVKEFTTAGSSVQTINLPTSVSGSNKRLTLSGTATSEGFISLSADGNYLTIGGYDANPGTASVTSSIGGRVVGRIDMSGNVDTTTVLGDAASIGNIRSVISKDGAEFWVGSSTGGVRYATFGATGASTGPLASTPVNTRVLNIFSNQLYMSSASGTFQGIATVGTGLPTTTGQTATALSGFPTTTGPSNYDYVFADANTLYVADDRSTTTLNTGGLEKWVFNGSTWQLKYTLITGLTTGLRGLTGVSDGAGNEILYATSADTLSKLVTITDSLTATTLPGTEAFTTLATAATNTAFRGVELIPAPAAVPEPAAISLLAAAPLLLGKRRRK